MHLLALFVLVGQLQRSSVAESGAVGLLIGLHHVPGTMDANDSSRRPTGGSLSTIWIPLAKSSGVSGTGVMRVSDLLLPRRSGFWRAGLLGTCAEEMDDGREEVRVTDYPWFAPIGRTPTVTLRSDPGGPREHVGPCRAPEIDCITDARTEVAWIWPEFASLNFSGDSDCGAHPSSSLAPTLRDIDHPAQPLTIGQALGPSAEAPMRDAFAAAKREHLADVCKGFPDPVEFDPAVWNITRSSGEWRATGWAETDRLCGYGFDYSGDVDLLRVTGHRAEQGSLLQQVKATHPDVHDAHMGPGGWVLAITETELLLLSSSDHLTLRVPISPQDHVVMVEWATGSNVSRWSKAVLNATMTGPVKPRVVVPPTVRK